MKKKNRIILITSLIIQMFISLVCIINANDIVSNLKESFNTGDIEYMDTINKMITNKYIYGISTLTIISLLVILLLVLFSKKIFKYKTLMIVLTVLTFLFSVYNISYLFIILDIVLLSKIVVDKDYIDVRRDIPSIEYKSSSSDKIKAIIMIIVYFILITGGFGFLDISSKYANIISIFIYLILISLSLGLFHKEIFSNFKLFKDNIGSYMHFIFNKLRYGYGIYLIMALLAVVLKGNLSNNQEELMGMSKFMVIPLACLYAPLVEETVFRFSLRKLIKNDKLFVILSAISFGVIHTITEGSIYNVVVASLPYVALGFIFAYLYVKSNNTFTNMFSHFLQNSIASIVMLLI